LSNRMIDIAIIGAGIAGITCASRLHRQFVVQVFESSTSIGGRTKSIKLSENVIVNLGANWLAGQRNPLARFVAIRNLEEKEEELCVSVLNEDFIDITDEYMPLADEYMMALDRLEKSNEQNSISIREALTQKINYQYPTDDYLSSAVQYLVGNEGYTGFDDAHSSHGDTITTELLYKENGERIDLVVDDTARIVTGIANEEDYPLDTVKFNYRLVAINQTDDYYTCHFENGKIIEAKSIVLTVPISQLQQRKIAIDFIPESKWAKIDQVPWAHFANVFVLLENCQLPKMTYYLPISDQNPFRHVSRVDHFDGSSVLHFMTIGEDAKRVCAMEKSDVEKAITFILTKVYKQKPKIISFSHPKWSIDQDYMGAYTNAPILPRGENLEHFYRDLSKPVGRLYFAGEAYDYVNGGFMQGAYNSACQVADSILDSKKT